MAKRGRKSAASLDIAGLTAHAKGDMHIVVRERPRPPQYGLTQFEKDLWNQIVDERPADWFDAAALPLLIAYVRAAYLHHRATYELEKEDLTVVNVKTGQESPNPKLRIQMQTAQVMATLATKMKLTQSSVSHPLTAGTKLRDHKATSQTRKPWETA